MFANTHTHTHTRRQTDRQTGRHAINRYIALSQSQYIRGINGNYRRGHFIQTKRNSNKSYY